MISAWGSESDKTIRPIDTSKFSPKQYDAKKQRFKRIRINFEVDAYVRKIFMPWFTPAHWSLYVFDMETQQVLYYDSLSYQTPTNEPIKTLQFVQPLFSPDTLHREDDDNHATSTQDAEPGPSSYPSGPVQKNGHDCGPLVLLTMQCLVWNPDVVSKLGKFAGIRRYIASNLHDETIKKLVV